MKYPSVLFITVLLAVNLLAQQSAVVSGKLIIDGQQVRNQLIHLVGQGLLVETKTDSEGLFRFENVPDGNYIIRFGNRNASVEVSSGSVKVSKFAEVVVVSSGTVQPVSDVAKTTTTITRSESQSRNEISLAGALSTVPGFRLQQLGGFGRLTSIKTRGLRNQDTAVLIDGFRFRDSATITGDASPFISSLTFPNGGDVEVLRGSGSSLYGTNAIGGVIDFRSPEPTSSFTGDLTAEYGGLGMTRFEGRSSARTKDGRFGFSAGLSNIRFTEGIDGADDADNLSFRSRIDVNPGDRTSISGRIFLSDAFSRLNFSPDTTGTQLPIDQVANAQRGFNFLADQDDPDNFQRSNFFSGQIALTQIFSPDLVLRLGYQGLITKRENENGPLGPGFQPFGGIRITNSNGEIHTLNAKLDWSAGSNNFITAGYEYELEKYESVGTGPTAAGDSLTNVNQSSNTFFVQDLVSLHDGRLQIGAGFRAQWFSLDQPTFSAANPPYEGITFSDPDSAFTFDGSVSYYFRSTDTKVRAHIGNGYRVPSLYERFGSFFSSFSQSFVALGDPRLTPESSIAVDAGIDQSFLSEKVKVSGTYFYTRLLDTIGFQNAAPDIGSTTRPFGGYFNTRGGIARGLEFSGTVNPLPLGRITASYTYTNSDQRESQVAGSGILRTLGIADHQFSLVWIQQIRERTTVSFDFLATSNYLVPIFSNQIFATRIYRFDGARRGDLTVRYEHPVLDERARIVFLGSLDNVFDNTYFENGFQTAGRTGRVGIGFEF